MLASSLTPVFGFTGPALRIASTERAAVRMNAPSMATEPKQRKRDKAWAKVASVFGQDLSGTIQRVEGGVGQMIHAHVLQLPLRCTADCAAG